MENLLAQNDFFDSTNKSVAKQSPIMRRHCGSHLESAAEPKPAVARLSSVEPFSHVPDIQYPVGDETKGGRSAQTPTCESLCAAFRSNLTGRQSVEVWVAFLLGVLTDMIHTRKRNPADT
jgi:hypothetical protein